MSEHTPEEVARALMHLEAINNLTAILKALRNANFGPVIEDLQAQDVSKMSANTKNARGSQLEVLTTLQAAYAHCAVVILQCKAAAQEMGTWPNGESKS